LVAFYIANVLFGAGLFAHAFLYNFYLEGLAHGPVVMGNAAAALTAGGLTALVPAGLVADRLGPRVSYFLAAAAAGLGLMAGAVAERPMAIYLTAFLAGIGTAGWRVSMGPLVMRLAEPAGRARAFSWNVALLVGSGAVWTVIAGGVPAWLNRTLGWEIAAGLRVVLVAGGIATVLAGVWLALTVGRAQFAADADMAAVTTEATTKVQMPRGVLIGVVLVGLWMAASALVLPFFNVYFARVHGLPIERVGLVLAGAQALTALVLLASGELATRLGPRRALLGWLVVFGPVLLLLSPVTALPLALCLFLVQGFVPPATNPLIDQILLDRTPPARHGAVSSWRNAATETSGLIGASVGGRVLQATSFPGLFAVAGVLALVGAAGLYVWLKRFGQSAEDGLAPSRARTETVPRMSR
jgi:MFS family permease